MSKNKKMEHSRYNIDFISLTRVPRFRDLAVPLITEVSRESSTLLHQAVEQCARYFQREGYSDWKHYDESDYNSPHVVSYLFTDGNFPHAIGAACFRLREFRDLPEKIWTMHWVWIHPYARNKGLLSEHISQFNAKFGYWYPETPHSKGMTSFIAKHNIVSPLTHFNLPDHD